MKDKSIKKIEQTIMSRRMFKKRTLQEIYHSNIWIRYAMKDGLYAKLLFLVRFSLDKLKPTSEDKKFLALPAYLYFLYYIVKPFRLIKKYTLLTRSLSSKWTRTTDKVLPFLLMSPIATELTLESIKAW